MSEGLAAHVDGWNPGPQTVTDELPPGPAAALAAVLDRPGDAPEAGEELPPLWHWLYFLEWVPQAELGADGHPARGHFLPPIPERTRMFAGGRLRVHAPLRVGRVAERTSVLAGVNVKQGRAGELLFVTVRHEIRQDGELRVTDEGKGMSPEQATAALNGGGGGVGLSNVNARLTAAFGREYALAIESVPGQVTTVVMTVPKFRAGVRAA